MDIGTLIEQIKALGTGVRGMDDPFFEEGNEICHVYTRCGIKDEDDESLCHEELKKFTCGVQTCQAEFDNLLNFELHYNSCHRFTCSECKKQLLSPHLLDLHLSETHDSFFKALSERKPMFRCFVETCDVMSLDAKARRSHCIEDHNFPHDFKFNLQPRKISKNKKQKALAKKSNDDNPAGMEIGEDKSPQSPKKQNKFFTFGHKTTGKVFSAAKPTNNLDMKDLMESLPS